MTPTWLAATALLAGQRPPDVTHLERYVLLGCGDGETAAVVAANHPNTEVWVWDQHPGSLEATRRLARRDGLDNLRVHEHRDLPLDLGGGPADVIVVQDVPSVADDALRHRLRSAIDASLRPGGLLCVLYPTLAGWAEVAPVQALMRQLAVGHRGPVDELVPSVLDAVDRLRAGGARYLTARPAVADWLATLATLASAEVEARYLRDPFRPMSPAQAAALAPRVRAPRQRASDRRPRPRPRPGARRRGAGRGDPPHPGDLPRPRHPALLPPGRLPPWRGAPRRGRTQRALAHLSLAGLATTEEHAAADVDRDAWRKLTTVGVTAGELDDDPAQVAHVVAVLMDAGQTHPVVSSGPSRRARRPARRSTRRSPRGPTARPTCGPHRSSAAPSAWTARRASAASPPRGRRADVAGPTSSSAWNDGYVVDVAYTEPIIGYLCPSHISMSAVLHGQPPLPMDRPLTWLDLGSGSGVSACMVAAANPDVEVWGCDFNPAHVERARAFAADAGLSDVCTFDEASFAEVAANDDLGPPSADVIVVHGVYSWISRATRSTSARSSAGACALAAWCS